MKHTPGPWTLCAGLTDQDHDLVLMGPSKDHDLGEEPVGGLVHFSESDARLVSAAPEMLRALRNARIALLAYGPVYLLEEINAAIEKAEGEC